MRDENPVDYEQSKSTTDSATAPAKWRGTVEKPSHVLRSDPPLVVALTTQCPYCLEIHKGAAIKAGATKEELAETIFIAAALRAGAVITHGTHLMDG
jgi:AhpD family alkylhydroperoxidase